MGRTRRWRRNVRRWRRALRRRLPALGTAVAVVAVVALLAAVWPEPDPPVGPVPAVPPPGAAPDADVVAWAEDLADGLRVPAVALAAYGRAQLRTADEQPGCGLTWTTLAGIGSVESDHGRYGGAVLDANGTSTPPIIGIALDGGPGLADIADTDGGVLDGDVQHDRAVGPLQFIPETWSRWAADGDGDGARDVFDVDDAALAAARYLCAADRDLTRPEGWAAAVFAYNRSGQYAADVRRAAAEYATRSTGG